MNLKKLILKTALLLNYLFLFNPVLADDFNPNIKIGKPEEVKVTEFSPMIRGIIRIFFVIAVLLTFVFLLWGGIQWILSGGEKDKYEGARNRITAALIGLAIVALAWLIIKVVTYFFGLPDLFGSGEFPLPRAF